MISAAKEKSSAEVPAEFGDRGSVRNYTRLISERGSAIIQVDVSSKCDGSDVWVRDLGNVTMCLSGSKSLVQGTIPLRRLEGSYESMYLALQEQLAARSATNRLGQALSSLFNDLHRFFVWAARRGANRVIDIDADDAQGFLAEFAKAKSWESVLGADAAYEELRRELLRDPNARSRVATFISSRKTDFTFRAEELANLVGLPVHSSKIPSEFVRTCEKILGLRAQSQRPEGRCDAVSRRTLSGILTHINRLAYVQGLGSSDAGLTFIPFPRPASIAARLINRLPDARQNISLEDTIRLLAEARRWMEDYSPHIIWFYRRIPDWTSEESAARTDGLKTRIAVTARLRKEWSRLMEEHGLPGPICAVWKGNNGEKSFRDVLKSLLTACGVVIGVNHGRRLNEVFGEEDRLYGIYEGCLTTHQDAFERHEVRIWIEKTLLAWVTYSANHGTAKAVSILEEILCVGRDANGGDDLRRTDEGRIKLFQLVKPAGFEHGAASYLWHEDSRWFFELAGVPWESGRRGYYSFRRIFAQVYFYGYENPDIRALSRWLAHIGIKHTFAYVSDPASRDEFDRIDRKIRLVNKAMEDEIRQVGKEYLQDCLVRLIEGRLSGGGFSAYAIRVYRALAKRLKIQGDAGRAGERSIRLVRRTRL